jgi:CRP/FNR family transcriptional regulator, cyclic AMP receptor protein
MDLLDDVGPRQAEHVVVAADVARVVPQEIAAEVLLGETERLDRRALGPLEYEDAFGHQGLEPLPRVHRVTLPPQGNRPGTRAGGRGTLPAMRAVPTRDTILPRSRRVPSAAIELPRPHVTLRRSVAALRVVPLFDGFTTRHLRRLAREADVVRFSAGRPIVVEGQSGEAMFVMLIGTALVVRRGRRVGSLIPGDFFGELSALDGGPRTASVVPETPVEALRVFRHTLRKMVDEEPALAMGLLEGLARRIRQVRPSTAIA